MLWTIQFQPAAKLSVLRGYFSGDAGRLYCISHSLLLAHEDKTFSGAMVALARIPWGEVKRDEDLGGYHLVWTRDMVKSVTALLACGSTSTACRALVYLINPERTSGHGPNFEEWGLGVDLRGRGSPRGPTQTGQLPYSSRNGVEAIMAPVPPLRPVALLIPHDLVFQS